MAEVFAAAPTEDERREHQAYEALLNALARPGEAQLLPATGFEVAGTCLLDLEVSFFASDVILSRQLQRTGARQAEPENADYLFFPTLHEAAVAEATKAGRGDRLYPERAATLFIGAHFNHGRRLDLTGPGIQGERQIRIDGVAPAFWAERTRACRYPLGWDVFLIDGAKVIGLPRSTKLEAGPWPM